jgi:hypothetical protein
MDVSRIYFGAILFNAAVVLRHDPALIAERAETGPNAKSWDRVLRSALTMFTLLILVIAGLDVRYGWSHHATVPRAARPDAHSSLPHERPVELAIEGDPTVLVDSVILKHALSNVHDQRAHVFAGRRRDRAQRRYRAERHWCTRRRGRRSESAA